MFELILGKISENIELDRKEHPVCKTPQCKKRADLIKEYMDRESNPCEDFFSYACGRWIKQNENAEQSYDAFKMARDLFLADMAGILEKANAVHGSRSVINKVATLYKACVGPPKGSEKADILDLMKLHGISEWPTTNQNSKPRTYKEVILSAGISPIVQYYVGRSGRSAKKNALKLFTLGIRNVVTPDVIKKAVDFLDLKISDCDLSNITRELGEFEANLMQLRRYGLPPSITEKTFNDLEKDTEFPLAEVLKKEFLKAQVTLTGEETVEIYSANMYEKVVEFLKGAEPRTLSNYIGLHVIIGLAEFTFVELGTQLPFPKPSRSEQCVGLVHSAMKEATTYLYAMHHAPPEAKKQIEKLLSKIAYPSSLLNADVLEGLYKDIKNLESESSFVKMMHTAVTNKDNLMMRKLQKPYDKNEEWFYSLSAVTAFYNPTGNELVYPVGGLRYPFYDYALPMSANFGGIGAVIAHEITHSLTGKGSLYDADGQQGLWWEPEDLANYKSKSSCFENQYGNVVDKKTNMTIDGKKTLEENIADTVGLHMALKAYTSLLEEECKRPAAVLEGLEDMWGLRLFFVSYAMVWCEAATVQDIKNKIERLPHSPNQYRVNIPVNNLQEFADVFGCKEVVPDNNLNSKSKCNLF